MTERELGYAGGIVDGEGTIGIYKHSAARNRDGSYRQFPPLRVHVQVSQCDIRLPIWLKEKFGGYISTNGIPGPNDRQGYIWALQGKAQCLPFLTLIRPYLFLKQDRADIAIAFMNLCNYRICRGMSPERKQAIYSNREKLRSQLKALNKVGSSPPETKRSGAVRPCDSPICKEENLQSPLEIGGPSAS